jgi:hypothetical protein
MGIDAKRAIEHWMPPTTLAASTDHGEHFGPPVCIAYDWKLFGCPESGPVAAVQDNKLIVDCYTATG